MNWEPYNSGTSVFVVDKRNNAIICRIMVGDASADVRDANARLIAAAPDLLEALESMVEMVEMNGFGKAAMMEMAKAAIDKAREDDEH